MRNGNRGSRGLWNEFLLNVVHSGNRVNQLLAINIAVFLFFGLFSVGERLMGFTGALSERVQNWFAFQSAPLELLIRPWTLITYQFMHAGLGHIFFNMLMLWFAGRVLRLFLGDGVVLSTYLLGGISGAILFFLACNTLPFFGEARPSLVGASASILALLGASAAVAPTYPVNLLFLGEVKLIYIALVLFAIDLLSVAGINSGGHIAHIGGFAYGYSYILLRRRGWDMAIFFARFAERFRFRRSRMKVHRNAEVQVSDVRRRMVPSERKGSSIGRGKGKPQPQNDHVTQDQVDAILDKISRSGYDSLSEIEKGILQRASRDL